MTKKAFLKLQQQWYKKLEKAGFQDIEEFNSPNEMLKRKHNNDFRSRRVEQVYSTQLGYFYKAGHFLTNYSFGTALDRAIWAAHADGLSYREIADKLKTNRDKVHKAVIRLKKVMLANNY